MDCPKCGRDYYEEFDESSHCFGCGYHEVSGLVSNGKVKKADLLFYLTTFERKDFKKIYAKWKILPEELSRFKIRKAVDHPEGNEWIYIPCGKHWQLRAFSDGCKSRYFMKTAPPEGMVWTSWGKTQNKLQEIIIVEGVMDAIRVSHFGHAVALFGSDANDARIETLRSLADKFLIMLDGDAIKKSLTLQKKLGILDSRIIVLEEDKDPADYTDDELEKLLL